ncbi:phosphonopyruvate decarboxylase [Nitriliruptor alkaliphilus]|uniref:phosphonopyruvate decarboxylase n=1 Tax=Nitriliruptor alkaliphilus TaxID=427918 RepID=UPI000695B482|nr:phosphonopyruvate decarboxylase [Nitriliruptor alkaliphilus]
MIDPARFVAHLAELGVSMYTGVPDSLLKSFGKHVHDALPREQHIIAANEGAAVGLALGHHLRTREVAAVYLQNSGFGNTVNPLLSLADPDVYGVPMLVIVGWRGQPGVKDEPQHVKQGRVMTALLDALELPWATLPTEPDVAEQVVTDAVRAAVDGSTPSFLLVAKDTFGPAPTSGSTAAPADPSLPSREEGLTALVEAIGDGQVLISTTGMLSRELFELRERTGTDPSRDFLTVGGMGHASAIALGVALREPEREVWCLDGDGALLMHAGSLAVNADHAPANYLHVVFNNGVHDSVGGQPTSIDKVDIPAAALAMGYRYAAATSDLSTLPAEVAALREHGGPSLLELRVRPGNRPDIGRPTRTPAQSKRAFMDAVAPDAS